MLRNVIIVAGGIGTRMNASVPKQFLLLNGKPLLMHSIEKFFTGEIKIIIVLPSPHVDEWKKLCNQFSFFVPHQIATGGNTRSESVENGLKLVDENSFVAVHDAVRPLVSKSLIEKLFVEAEKKGNAVPVVQVKDSIRKVEGEKSFSVNRKDFYIVQTPQIFYSNTLKHAFQKIKEKNFTDEASLVESLGEKINLVEGEETNLKITFPHDLAFAEQFLKTHL
jgi:2-C-methyl-D-erythritol 4-phosphate cytidylyltransferase